jgi:hypothetical protein
MYNFIEDLVAKRQPNQSLWDLRGGNRDALAFRRRVNFLCGLPSGIILFDFGQYSTVLWKIAVSEAATALYGHYPLTPWLCPYDSWAMYSQRRIMMHTCTSVLSYSEAVEVAPLCSMEEFFGAWLW